MEDYSVTCEMYNSDVKHCEHKKSGEKVMDMQLGIQASAKSEACHNALVNFENSGQSNSCVNEVSAAGSYKTATGALVMALGLALGLSI